MGLSKDLEKMAIGGKPKKKFTGEYVNFTVNGVDSHEAKICSSLKNIEAGSYLNGFIILRTKVLPPNPCFLFNFKLVGKFNRHERFERWTTHTDSEGRTRRVRHVDHSQNTHKWLKDTTKLALYPIPMNGQPDPDGLFTLRFPYSYPLRDDLCDSFHFGLFFCKYSVQMKCKSVDKYVRVKTPKRDIDIIARRPTITELTTRPSRDDSKHSSLTGGGVEANCQLDSFVFIEGQVVSFDVTIKNTMSKPVMLAEIKLQCIIGHQVKNLNFSPGHQRETSVTDLCNMKLRALEIEGNMKTHRIVKFALNLPAQVEPPTTRLSSGDMDVNYQCHLRLDVPWGIDCNMELPVKIIANPVRYVVSPPNTVAIPPPPANWSCPPHYQILAPAPVYVPWVYQGPMMMVLNVSHAKDLPKMDGIFGKCDGYVTVWLNDLHVRTTHTINSNLNPVWNSDFVFYLDRSLQGQRLNLKFICYDYDMASGDDCVGRADAVVDATMQGKEMSVVLQKKEKNGDKPRGTLFFKLKSLY